MTTPDKCAHPPCACDVPINATFGKYCSEHCQDAQAVLTAVRCDCKHSACH